MSPTDPDASRWPPLPGGLPFSDDVLPQAMAFLSLEELACCALDLVAQASQALPEREAPPDLDALADGDRTEPRAFGVLPPPGARHPHAVLAATTRALWHLGVRAFEPLKNTISQDPELVRACVEKAYKSARFAPPRGHESAIELFTRLATKC